MCYKPDKSKSYRQISSRTGAEALRGVGGTLSFARARDRPGVRWRGSSARPGVVAVPPSFQGTGRTGPLAFSNTPSIGPRPRTLPPPVPEGT